MYVQVPVYIRTTSRAWADILFFLSMQRPIFPEKNMK